MPAAFNTVYMQLLYVDQLHTMQLSTPPLLNKQRHDTSTGMQPNYVPGAEQNPGSNHDLGALASLTLQQCISAAVWGLASTTVPNSWLDQLEIA